MAENGIVAIGERVRERRTQLGLNQVELAAKANLSPSYISRLEAGQTGERLEDLVKVAQALGWRLSQLVGGSENELLAELRRQLPSGTDVSVIFGRVIAALAAGSPADQTFILRSLENIADRYGPPGETGESSQA